MKWKEGQFLSFYICSSSIPFHIDSTPPSSLSMKLIVLPFQNWFQATTYQLKIKCFNAVFGSKINQRVFNFYALSYACRYPCFIKVTIT